MDSIDTIGLFVDQSYLADLLGINDDNLNWVDYVKLYEADHVQKCVPPNREFAADEELLYRTLSTGKKECNLDRWQQPISEKAFHKLIKSSFTFPSGLKAYREKLFQNNLKEVAKYFPNDLEKLLSLGDITNSEWNIKIKGWVLNALNDNPNNELNPESLDYLETMLNADAKIKNAEILVKPAAKLLIHYVTHFEKDPEHKHANFLIDLFKKEHINANTKEFIFKQFVEEVCQIKNWEDTQFDNFSKMLTYDDNFHVLAVKVFNSQKCHNYIPSFSTLPYFEKLLDIEVIKEDTKNIIAKSLESSLLTKISNGIDSEVQSIEDRVINLQNKAGTLPSGLVGAIFEVYKIDQSCFNGVIVDVVAEDKLLSEQLLEKLIHPLENINNPTISLFIATRLVQNGIDLPTKTLKHFIQFLNNADQNVRVLAVDLYYQKLTKIPEELHSELAEALLPLLSRVSVLQHSKISEILDEINLDEAQSLKFEIQDQIYTWHNLDNLNEKIKSSEELYSKISVQTAEMLIPFFKEHLYSQNVDLLVAALEAFKKLQDYQQIFWSSEEKDLLSLTQASDKDSTIVAFDNVKFLLSAQQKLDLEEQMNSLSLKVQEFTKKIDFTDIRELKQLLNFIKSNEVSEELLKSSLDENLDIAGWYSKVLKGLIFDLGIRYGLDQSNEKALKTSVEFLVERLYWPADFLFRLINYTEQGSFLNLISVLEKLANYRVNPEAMDREGRTSFEVLWNLLAEELLNSINRVINDNHFYVVKNVNSLLEELKHLNPNNARIQGLIDSKYFVEQLLKIEYILDVSGIKPTIYEKNKIYLYKENDQFYLATALDVKKIVDVTVEEVQTLNATLGNLSLLTQEQENLIFKQAAKLEIRPVSKDINPVLRHSDKDLSEWESDDFLEWRKSIGEIKDENISEVLVVISQAAYNTLLKGKAYPRPIQIITVLSLWKSPDGGLAQITTGEGKTLINAIFAIIKVLQGRQVDIVTSSSVLAKTHINELEDFYAQFGISVAHNIDGAEKDGIKKCYLADVVYGTTLHFIGDGLRDISRDTKMGRNSDVLIVDEVDSMFIDQNSMKVQLSSTIEGFDAFIPMYIYMYGTILVMASQVVQTDTGCYLKAPVLTDEQKEMLDPEVIKNKSFELQKIGENCGESLKKPLVEHIEDLLFAWKENRNSRAFIVPTHLESFAENQLPKWVDTLISSFSNEEKFHYIKGVNPDPNPKYSFPIIAPIDYEYTGVIQYSMQWIDGLHQFLQIKHGLMMYSESVTSIFMSYFGFFNKYRGNIFGVTGTLGEKSHHEFLQKVYGVELSIIPTFIEKDLTEFEPIIVNGKKAWQQAIVDVVKRIVGSQNRAGLIIVETIEQVEGLKTQLENANYDKAKLFVYGTGSAEDYNVEGKLGLKPGEVVIATNMAGRGTDLQLSSEVIKNGGLHVIMGGLSKSIRVEDQGFGRAARKGEPGSAQVIINLEQVGQTECKQEDSSQERLIDCLNEERTYREIQKLESDRLCKLPELRIRDRLFDLYVESKKEIISPTNYKLIVGKPDKVEEKSLYLYEQDDKIILRIVPAKTSKNKDEAPLDITEWIKTIGPFSAKHIRTVLSRKDYGASGLNKQDYEIIHFIAAIKGYSDYPEIYNRVEYRFNNLVEVQNPSSFSSVSQKEAYLELLSRVLSKSEDIPFADLRNDGRIDETVLKKAQMRVKYDLWIKDRELYHNEYESLQFTDYWGMWFKNASSQLELKKCNVSQKEFEDKFYEFRAFIDKEKEEGRFFKNPVYPVKKAWHLYNIKQKEDPSQARNAAITADSSKGWFDWIVDTANSVLEYIVGTKRLSFGKENFAPENPLESAKRFADMAIGLDEIYSAAGYNARSAIELIKDGSSIKEAKQETDALEVKQKFIRDQNYASERINQYIIPSFESTLAFLFTTKIVEYGSDIVVQLQFKLAVYKAIVSVLQDNIEVTTQSGKERMIRMGQFVSEDELTKDINITEELLTYSARLLRSTNATKDVETAARQTLNNIISAHNMTALELATKGLVMEQISGSGLHVFHISTYELDQEDTDWTGTILAAVIGIASIYTGLWIINTFAVSSIFAATLGSSLVLQGAGDIVQSLMAVGMDNPIDFSNFINAKGMAMGITLATAATLHFVNMIPYINGLGFLQAGADGIANAAGNPTKFLMTTFATHAASLAASAGLQSAGKEFIDAKEIESDALGSVNKIIEAEQESIARIYATDQFNGETRLEEQLNEGIKNAVTKHLKKFHDDKTTATVGIGTSVGGQMANAFGSFAIIGSIINAGTHVTMGIIKDNEALEKVASTTRNKIRALQSQCLSSGAMMERLLEKNFGRDNLGHKLFEEIQSQNFVQNGEIGYRNCNKFEELKLEGRLKGHNRALVENCNAIAKMLLEPKIYDKLKNVFVSSVKSLKENIQKQEILAPITQAIGGEIGQVVGKEFIESLSSKAKEDLQVGANKFKKQETLDQKKIALQSGLGKKQGVGGDSNQREGASNNGQTGSSIEEKVESIISSSKTPIEIEGESYIVFEESTKTFGEDGITIIKEEILVRLEKQNLGEPVRTVLVNIDRVGGRESLNPEEMSVVQARIGNVFAASMEAKGDNNAHEALREVEVPITNRENLDLFGVINSEDLMASKKSDYEGGGIGAGLLSMKDGEAIRNALVAVWPSVKEIATEIVSNPYVQGSLGCAEGMCEVIAGVSIGLATCESVVGVGVGMAIAAHGVDTVKTGIKKLQTGNNEQADFSKLIELTSVSRETADEVNSYLGAASGFGVGVVKIVEKKVAETIGKVVLKEGKESTVTVVKAESKHAGKFTDEFINDFNKIEAGFVSSKNLAYFNKYKIEGFDFAESYNNWLKTVDLSKVQKHHVLSNKGGAPDAIRNHKIFKEGILDVKILKSNGNIMPLPKKPEMHPTMNVHPSGRHTDIYKAEMNRELNNIYEAVRNKDITQEGALSRFWKLVDEEKERLFKGESNIYKKRGE